MISEILSKLLNTNSQTISVSNSKFKEIYRTQLATFHSVNHKHLSQIPVAWGQLHR